MIIRKLLLLLSVTVLLFATGQINAETQFIKYKNYLIPINTDNCEGISDKEHVLYIDDVEDTNVTGNDSNGVYELPIIIGWKHLYNLVGIGADGDNDSSFRTSFVQDLITRAGDITPVLTGSSLEDEIIKQALIMSCSDKKLNIVIGGPWNVVADAIEKAKSQNTPIKDYIRVVGIGGSNVGFNNKGGRTTARTNIYDELTTSNVKEIYQSQFERFTVPSNYFVGNRNQWYQTHFDDTAIVQRLAEFRLDEHNVRLNYCSYGNSSTRDQWCNNFIDGNSNFPSNALIPQSERYLLRIADFTALAYVIWGDDIWTSAFNARMFTELELGLATLPR